MGNARQGTFDDAQAIVKESFQDEAFRNRVGGSCDDGRAPPLYPALTNAGPCLLMQVRLGAVNSINWARVLAQITYYFYAYFRVTQKDKTLKKISFSVPTGNFGDVLAAYYAKKMGLPIDKLIVATNENDILHRFFTSGDYHKHGIKQTLSPSMDITISSNFERLLFDLAGNDAAVLKGWMDEFEKSDKLRLPAAALERAREDFLSARVDMAATKQIIETFHLQHGYVLCPHTAVGVDAARQLGLLTSGTVCLATAHHAKFPEATQHLAQHNVEDPPSQLRDLAYLPSRSVLLPNNGGIVRRYMERTLAGLETNRLLRYLAVRNFMRNPWTLTAVAVVGMSIVAFQLYNRRLGGRR
jgi:threonine synthase